ncbi:hypothetical protein CEXT_245901 [Caerostris extrusa]|uniref:Uncharacterized protein n=1 Tax=Caerostris extrusa TaxID=172846 RepID=A0AAV4MFN0_CAEEX|nr:hypothetical protein CEXT_245901 [Caerostris extrusa]
MGENLRRIHRSLENITDRIESTILHASNVFNEIEQDVHALISLDPETLGTDECLEREQDSNLLIEELQEFRKETETIMGVYEIIVGQVRNQNHPTLLLRLETDMKWKFTDLFSEVLDKELLIDCYKIKLEFRQTMSNFPRGQ